MGRHHHAVCLSRLVLLVVFPVVYPKLFETIIRPLHAVIKAMVMLPKAILCSGARDGNRSLNSFIWKVIQQAGATHPGLDRRVAQNQQVQSSLAWKPCVIASTPHFILTPSIKTIMGVIAKAEALKNMSKAMTHIMRNQP
jgi:hypothetical protein